MLYEIHVCLFVNYLESMHIIILNFFFWSISIIDIDYTMVNCLEDNPNECRCIAECPIKASEKFDW